MLTKTALRTNLISSSKWRGVQQERTFLLMSRSCCSVSLLPMASGPLSTSQQVQARMEVPVRLSLIWSRSKHLWRHPNNLLIHFPKSYQLRAGTHKDRPSSRIAQEREWCLLHIRWLQYPSWSLQLPSLLLKWQWLLQVLMHTATNIKRNNFPPAMEGKMG